MGESGQARHVIYVDAGSTNTENYRISLYDKVTNATHIMDLIDIANNTEAEKYAIFYAIHYIYKNRYSNCIVLCDNQNAVKDKIITSLAHEYGIAISWIPREINDVADRVCKLDSTLKDKEFYSLKLFVELGRKAYSLIDNDSMGLEIFRLEKEIEALNKTINEKNQKISNQAVNITYLNKTVGEKNKKIQNQANQIANLQRKIK